MPSFLDLCLGFLSAVIGTTFLLTAARPVQAQQPPRLVESIDITGNRRLRKEDILYWVQTRPGDPYNASQIERDLQAILTLGFFDKTSTRVLIEDGPRGGVNVIFEVKELPIIRDLQFEGVSRKACGCLKRSDLRSRQSSHRSSRNEGTAVCAWTSKCRH